MKRRTRIILIICLFLFASLGVLILIFTNKLPDRSLPILEYNKQMIERIPGYTREDADAVASIFKRCAIEMEEDKTSFFTSRIQSAEEIRIETENSIGEPLTVIYCRLIMENGESYDVLYGRRKKGGGIPWAIYRGPWENNDLIVGIIM